MRLIHCLSGKNCRSVQVEECFLSIRAYCCQQENGVFWEITKMCLLSTHIHEMKWILMTKILKLNHMIKRMWCECYMNDPGTRNYLYIRNATMGWEWGTFLFYFFSPYQMITRALWTKCDTIREPFISLSHVMKWDYLNDLYSDRM